ncbi:MAG: carboxypeptidase-like regulatory domain-containing protein, partial [Deltaproteobacteria bacterium]
MKKVLFISFLAVVLGLSAIAHANAYTISGSVKDSSTNQGIPAATVTVRNGSNAAVATISTDQAGNYTTTVATAGDYYASAAKAGYDDFSPPPYPVEISVTSPAAVFNMVLTPAGAPPATLSLAPGWNLISLPLQPADNAIATVLSGIAGKYSIVWGDFDPAPQRWKFKGASGGGSLNTMDAGKAYWIYIADTNRALLTVKGNQTEHSITLKPGWNFIGYNKLTETAAADAIISIAGKFSIIWGDFNPTTQQWKFKSASGSGSLNRFESGKGYWIRANEASLWTLPSGSTPPPGTPSMNTDQTVSDQAQSMTIAFDGLAFVTGSFCAQTFYPPGKVADFFGFQYLRDNDLSGMGHNTDFTTLTADPILVLLNDVQLKILSDLGTAEATLNDNYGYARFPLAKAFRRLNDGDLPTGKTGLSRDAVKAFSAYLFSIDGEMSYLRAKAYASVLGSMDTTQQATLAAMKGKGSLQWTQPTDAQVNAVLAKYPGQMMRTYAGEMLAWYLGNIDADVYFCPEREGTYFGSFFMKDIKAMNNPS